jgi:hypothetical protein
MCARLEGCRAFLPVYGWGPPLIYMPLVVLESRTTHTLAHTEPQQPRRAFRALALLPAAAPARPLCKHHQSIATSSPSTGLARTFGVPLEVVGPKPTHDSLGCLSGASLVPLWGLFGVSLARTGTLQTLPGVHREHGQHGQHGPLDSSLSLLNSILHSSPFSAFPSRVRW